jgi:MoxR-like ATPase
MDENTLREALAVAEAVGEELSRVVVGQEKVVQQLLTAFIAGGHVLLEGVPGLAKTLSARCLAAALDLSYSRIQFTPDLMPADITGVNVFDSRTTEFVFRPGPIFADLVLADEINRAPAKTQSALLEAMQEKQVTVDGVAHGLSEQFMVVATQNPIEFEGTYPLPEAQLDRFIMKILIDYPDKEKELVMLETMNSIGEKAHDPHHLIARKAGRKQILSLRRVVHEIETDRSVLAYIVELVHQSRSLPSLTIGASPRAAVMMLHAAKALALLRGNAFVGPDEVQAVVSATLRHRVTLTPEAQIEGLTPDICIENLLKQVPVPR